MVGEFPNLTGVLTRPICGDLITQQYDEMVKAAVPRRIPPKKGLLQKAELVPSEGPRDLEKLERFVGKHR
jgi:hypothetical protein